MPNPTDDKRIPFTYETGFTMDPKKTAFVPIDLQYASACRTIGLGKLLKEQGREAFGKYRYDRIEQIVVPNVQKLLTFFRKHRLRIIYVTLGSEMPDYSDILPHRVSSTKDANNRVGEREHEILDEIKPLPGELVINKTASGAFNSSSIDSVLRAMNIEYCLFSGVSTEMCVETTARGASDRGYKTAVIDDACATLNEQNHKNTLDTFKRGFGRVCTTDEVIKELESSIAAPDFRWKIE
jgi:nicotinamidase-related amidase